jgi:hypothetical protein
MPWYSKLLRCEGPKAVQNAYFVKISLETRTYTTETNFVKQTQITQDLAFPKERFVSSQLKCG